MSTEYYISKRYDNDTYDVSSLSDTKIFHLTKAKLKERIKSGFSVYGAILSTDDRLYCTCAYTPVTSYDEDEAYDERHQWINENPMNEKDAFCEKIGKMWYFFEPNYTIVHVAYYVYYQAGEYHYYVSKYKDKRATPYIQSAKEFTQETAYAVAQKLTNSKKNYHNWYVECIVS